MFSGEAGVGWIQQGTRRQDGCLYVPHTCLEWAFTGFTWRSVHVRCCCAVAREWVMGCMRWSHGSWVVSERTLFAGRIPEGLAWPLFEFSLFPFSNQGGPPTSRPSPIRHKTAQLLTSLRLFAWHGRRVWQALACLVSTPTLTKSCQIDNSCTNGHQYKKCCSCQQTPPSKVRPK